MTNQGNQGDTSNRGFASMDEEKQRQIASKGGKAAHEKGTAHEFSHEEAVAAGKKGGQANQGSSSEGQDVKSGQKNSGQFTPETAKEAGHKGGKH